MRANSSLGAKTDRLSALQAGAAERRRREAAARAINREDVAAGLECESPDWSEPLEDSDARWFGSGLVEECTCSFLPLLGGD